MEDRPRSPMLPFEVVGDFGPTQGRDHNPLVPGKDEDRKVDVEELFSKALDREPNSSLEPQESSEELGSEVDGLPFYGVAMDLSDLDVLDGTTAHDLSNGSMPGTEGANTIEDNATVNMDQYPNEVQSTKSRHAGRHEENE